MKWKHVATSKDLKSKMLRRLSQTMYVIDMIENDLYLLVKSDTLDFYDFKTNIHTKTSKEVSTPGWMLRTTRTLYSVSKKRKQ